MSQSNKRNPQQATVERSVEASWLPCPNCGPTSKECQHCGGQKVVLERVVEVQRIREPLPQTAAKPPKQGKSFNPPRFAQPKPPGEGS